MLSGFSARAVTANSESITGSYKRNEKNISMIRNQECSLTTVKLTINQNHHMYLWRNVIKCRFIWKFHSHSLPQPAFRLTYTGQRFCVSLSIAEQRQQLCRWVWVYWFSLCIEEGFPSRWGYVEIFYLCYVSVTAGYRVSPHPLQFDPDLGAQM